MEVFPCNSALACFITIICDITLACVDTVHTQHWHVLTLVTVQVEDCQYFYPLGENSMTTGNGIQNSSISDNCHRRKLVQYFHGEGYSTIFDGDLLQDLPLVSLDSDSRPFDMAPDGRIFLSCNPSTTMVFDGLNGLWVHR